jgi:hypothetical protein
MEKSSRDVMDGTTTYRFPTDEDLQEAYTALDEFYSRHRIHPIFAEFQDKALEREYQMEENIRSIPRRRKVLRIWILCKEHIYTFEDENLIRLWHK